MHVGLAAAAFMLSNLTVFAAGPDETPPILLPPALHSGSGQLKTLSLPERHATRVIPVEGSSFPIWVKVSRNESVAWEIQAVDVEVIEKLMPSIERVPSTQASELVANMKGLTSNWVLTPPETATRISGLTGDHRVLIENPNDDPFEIVVSSGAPRKSVRRSIMAGSAYFSVADLASELTEPFELGIEASIRPLVARIEIEQVSTRPRDGDDSWSDMLPGDLALDDSYDLHPLTMRATFRPRKAMFAIDLLLDYETRTSDGDLSSPTVLLELESGRRFLLFPSHSNGPVGEIRFLSPTFEDDPIEAVSVNLSHSSQLSAIRGRYQPAAPGATGKSCTNLKLDCNQPQMEYEAHVFYHNNGPDFWLSLPSVVLLGTTQRFYWWVENRGTYEVQLKITEIDGLETNSVYHSGFRTTEADNSITVFEEFDPGWDDGCGAVEIDLDLITRSTLGWTDEDDVSDFSMDIVCDDFDEENDSRTSATPINSQTTRSDLVAADQDWYRISTSSPRLLGAELRHSTNNIQNSDLVMELRDSAGSILRWDFCSVDPEPWPAGDYYWVVQNNDTSRNLYELRTYALVCDPLGAVFLGSPSDGQRLSPRASQLLDWDAATNADSYNVCFGASYPPSSCVSTGSTSKTYSVTPGETYYWRVDAFESECNQTLSSETWEFTVCGYSISPSSEVFQAGGGSSTIGVSAPNGCGWSASSNQSWITITTGGNGNGSGSIGFSVDENNSLNSRQGSITVQGESFTVYQDGVECSYSLMPSGASVISDPVIGGFDVSAHTACSWTASTGSSWLHVTGGSSGSGDGHVSYRVDENTSSSPRSGSITVSGSGASVSFSIDQDGSAAPTGLTISGPTSVNENSGAQYTATATWSNGSTTTVSPTWSENSTYATIGSSGFLTTGEVSGNQPVTVSATFNFGGVTRSDTHAVTVIDEPPTPTPTPTRTFSPTTTPTRTPTGTQTTTPTWTATRTPTGTYDHTPTWTPTPSPTPTVGGTCTYTLSPASRSFSADGGNGTINVSTHSGCTWTVSSSSSWISISPGFNGVGSGTVNYQVSANTGPLRSANISVAGKIHTVTQTGGEACSFDLATHFAVFDPPGGTGSIQVSATDPSCSWWATTAASWIHITNGSNHAGSGSVTYTIAVNDTPHQRSATIEIVGTGGFTDAFTVTQNHPWIPVNFDISTISPEIGETVVFTADPRLEVLSWSFTSANCYGRYPAITCSGIAGVCSDVVWNFPDAGPQEIILETTTGSQTKALTVQNTGECPPYCGKDGPPTASFDISPSPAVEDEVVTFTDTSSASLKIEATNFSWNPTSPEIGQLMILEITGHVGDIRAEWNFGENGCAGYSQVQVCEPFFSNCSDFFFKFASGGAKTVSVTVKDPVTGDTLGSTSKTINVQNVGACDGTPTCSYSLDPAQWSFLAEGGNLTLSVATQPGCTWNATTVNPWITLNTPTNGTGSGSVSYVVAANTDVARNGAVAVKNQTHNIFQLAGGGGGGRWRWRWWWW